MAQKEIAITMLICLCSSYLRLRADTLWVFESSKSKSTEPNRKILEQQPIKDIIKAKKIDVVYIDTRSDPTWFAFLKSLGSTSVPAVYRFADGGEVKFLAHLITPEILLGKVGQGGAKNEKSKDGEKAK